MRTARAGGHAVPRRRTPRKRDGSTKASLERLEDGLPALRDALRSARDGDFSVRLSTSPEDGVLEEIAQAFNELLARNERLEYELDRVEREVREDGGIRRRVSLAATRSGTTEGAWERAERALTSIVHTSSWPSAEASRVLELAIRGDLSQTVPLEVDGHAARGDFLRLATATNALVSKVRTVTSELSRVVRAMGTEGRLGIEAQVDDVDGVWKVVVDDVNSLVNSLTAQVRSIALVSTAIANGDLSQKITVETRGEILDLKIAINATVDRLRAFAAEVIRVAREVGTEGKLGAQADVRGVSGIWQELTDSVNRLARNLTDQVRNIAAVTTAVASGDLSKKISVDASGEILELKDTINGMVDRLRTFASEVTRVAREVGTDGELGGQAQVPDVAGTWKDLTDNVNVMASNLTTQVRGIARVVTAVAEGDLSQKFVVEAKGEIAELADTINAMTDTLRTFADQVTSVAREVGIEGKLGGQARVPGVSGTWRDLTDNVNLMASNLTDQVRGIGRVVTAVANGDLSQRLGLVARGEIAELADTINNMTETLRTFADQVTNVAREVGIEGRLGGQATVPGAAGTWRGLTDNVNQLAANLTTQVRAISEVATAVIQGDLTRSISVEARGEVLGLKDTINQMIANLRDTTRTNREQDWLKTNLAKLIGLMQGQRNLRDLCDQILSGVTPVVGAQHGAFYVMEDDAREPSLKLMSTYAHMRRKQLASRFALGESLVGQCALERKPIVVNDVPEGYVEIGSGLGQAPPRTVAVIPVLFEGQVRAVIELASFRAFEDIQLTFLEQLTLNIGIALNLIGASMRTEELLQQLQGTNVELERRRRELEEKAALLEVKNREIADASANIENKAQELARVSQYKSQFLANMSHEIRTPLNSMMILAQMLESNEDGNLSDKQREWATTIHTAGRDLLALINQILDLSKVEAGRIDVHLEPCALASISEAVEQTFRPVAQQRGLGFEVDVEDDVPATITTDRQLLQQILKNLLSNAFKFTEQGEVRLLVRRAAPGGRIRGEALDFSVVDTGVGVPEDKRAIIFEAFQQADPSITRKYGGTGLGLTISREYARVLGGELSMESGPHGSTFTLRLPLRAEEGEASLPPKPRELPAPKPAAAPAPGRVDGEDAKLLAGRKILVVEDDPRNLYATTALLERHGMIVIPATNGREAHAQVRQHRDVAAVLMDVMLPEVDGYQVARSLRAQDGLERTPIIAFSAKASGTDRDQALGAGLDDYVVKPVEASRLFEVLARQIRRMAA